MLTVNVLFWSSSDRESVWVKAVGTDDNKIEIARWKSRLPYVREEESGDLEAGGSWFYFE